MMALSQPSSPTTSPHECSWLQGRQGEALFPWSHPLQRGWREGGRIRVSHGLGRVTVSCPKLAPASKPGAEVWEPVMVQDQHSGWVGLRSLPLCAAVIKACRSTPSEAKGKE